MTKVRCDEGSVSPDWWSLTQRSTFMSSLTDLAAAKVASELLKGTIELEKLYKKCPKWVIDAVSDALAKKLVSDALKREDKDLLARDVEESCKHLDAYLKKWKEKSKLLQKLCFNLKTVNNGVNARMMDLGNVQDVAMLEVMLAKTGELQAAHRKLGKVADKLMAYSRSAETLMDNVSEDSVLMISLNKMHKALSELGTLVQDKIVDEVEDALRLLKKLASALQKREAVRA